MSESYVHLLLLLDFIDLLSVNLKTFSLMPNVERMSVNISDVKTAVLIRVNGSGA
jgi:hypothetical protein